MREEIVMFGDIEFEKKQISPIQELYFNKILINVSTDRLIVSSKVQFDEKGFKYFIRYKNDFAKIFPYV